MSNTRETTGNGFEAQPGAGAGAQGSALVSFPNKGIGPATEQVAPTRATTTAEDKDIVLDKDTLANIQRGLFAAAAFFGDQSITKSHKSFQAGTKAATNYNGWTNTVPYDLVDARTVDDPIFYMTKLEFSEIQKRSKSIAAYGNITEQAALDFLIILCCIDKLSDMRKIADALQIPELDNAAILRQPFAILSIPNLEKIAYMASAVEALTKMFRRFTEAANNTDQSGGDDISSVMSNLSSILGGFGGGGGAIAALLEAPDAANAVGQLMSELISGKRIPMSVIAKNPNVASPSYIGKAMFGESPTALSNMDITQVFNKKIGVFPKPSNGGGTTAFGLQNFGSMGGDMSIKSLINKVITGGVEPAIGSFKDTLLNQAVNKVTSLTGAKGTEMINLKGADVAVPLMNALSAVASGTDKSPFSLDTFQKSWVLANSVSNHMQQKNGGFMDAVRLFA